MKRARLWCSLMGQKWRCQQRCSFPAPATGLWSRKPGSTWSETWKSPGPAAGRSPHILCSRQVGRSVLPSPVPRWAKNQASHHPEDEVCGTFCQRSCLGFHVILGTCASPRGELVWNTHAVTVHSNCDWWSRGPSFPLWWATSISSAPLFCCQEPGHPTFSRSLLCLYIFYLKKVINYVPRCACVVKMWYPSWKTAVFQIAREYIPNGVMSS